MRNAIRYKHHLQIVFGDECASGSDALVADETYVYVSRLFLNDLKEQCN